MTPVADKQSSPHPSLGPMLAVAPRLSGTASSTTHDILLWAIAIPAISLAVLARSIFTTLHEAPAAASDLPPSFLQLFHVNVGMSQLLLGCLLRCLTTLIMSAAFSAAAWLAPSWYLQRGREQLLAAARLFPKAITVVQLLLLPSHPLGVLQRVWLQTCTVGAKGLLAVMIWPLLFPTSVGSYLKLAPLECGLALAADVMFTFRTSSPPAFPPLSRTVGLALLYAVCGMALPATLLAFSKQLQSSRHQQPAPQAAPCLPQATGTSAPDTTNPNIQRYLAPPASPPAPPGGGTACCVGHIAPSHRSSESASTLTTASPPSGASATAGLPGSRTPVLYHSRVLTEVLCSKIHDDRALPHNNGTLAAVNPHPATLHKAGAFSSPAASRETHSPAELLQLGSTAGASDGWLRWAPLCLEAGAAEEVEVELTAASIVGGVEAVVQCRRNGLEVAEKLPTHAAGVSNDRVRLLLPPTLDPGPVAIHLRSTQEGRKSVLLGSLVTMALSPAAAREVLQACTALDGCGADVQDQVASAAEHQGHLLRDAALLRQLHGMGAELCSTPDTVHGVQQPACSTSCSKMLPPSTALLEAVLQHLAESSMLQCHALLAARCSGATSAVSSAAAAGDQQPRPVGTGSTTTTTTATPACPSAPAAFSDAPGAPDGYPAAPEVDPSSRRPSRRCWAGLWGGPASWLQHLAAAPSGPGYTSWRLQQDKRVDGAAWMVLTATTLAAKYLLDDLAFGGSWFWSVAVVPLHFAPAVAAHVLLAVAGEGVRGRREQVVLAFAVAKASACVAAVLASLPLPGPCRTVWSMAPITLVLHGIFRPCLQQGGSAGRQVPWREQLLASAIEELPKYASLTNTPSNGTGNTVPAAPAEVYAKIGLAVVALAAAVSCLAEGLYLHEHASAETVTAAAVRGICSGSRRRSCS